MLIAESKSLSWGIQLFLRIINASISWDITLNLCLLTLSQANRVRIVVTRAKGSALILFGYGSRCIIKFTIYWLARRLNLELLLDVMFPIINFVKIHAWFFCVVVYGTVESARAKAMYEANFIIFIIQSCAKAYAFMEEVS